MIGSLGHWMVTVKSSKIRRSAETAPVAERKRSDWLPSILLIVIAAAVLGPACVHEFTDWDDGINITQNPYLNPPSLGALGHFWAHPYDQLYIPLTYTVWWVLAHLAHLDTPDAAGIRLDPYVFHTANLLIHIAACLIVYSLLLRLSNRRWAALAGGVLFAIHPLQVEAVAWATGMKDVLCGFFSMLALWQYVTFAQLRSDAKTSNRIWWHYSLSTLALLGALLAKPSAVAVPLLALILDRWVVRRSWQAIIPTLVPWGALVSIFVIISVLSQKAASIFGGPLWARPLIAADSLAFYLYKIAFPVKLGVLYEHAPRVLLHQAWGWFAWLIPAAMAAAALLCRRRYPWVIAAVALVFAAPLPVLGLVSFEFEQYSTVADRYIYVGMLGPALALTFLLASQRGSKWIAVVSGVWLAAFGAAAFEQVGTWQDTTTLFQHAIAINPASATAYDHLAGAMLGRNDLDEAETFANRAIALDSHQVSAYLVLGTILEQKGRPKEEEMAYRRAVENAPTDPASLTDLAAVLAENPAPNKNLRLSEAASLCRRAIGVSPGGATAHQVLAGVLDAEGNLPGAVEEAANAVRLSPNDCQARVSLGRLLERSGRVFEANEQFSIALRLDPNCSSARHGLERLKTPH